MDGTRSALIVANDSYTDPGLSRLRAPDSDAQALARVLRDPDIGDFEVRVLLNEPAHEVSLAVEEFFADRRPDDLLLVHFSCHGVKDESGELYFAAANTRMQRLGATAVAAEFVNRRMGRSRSRRVVLLLDCCYAGAFERGMTARAGTGSASASSSGAAAARSSPPPAPWSTPSRATSWPTPGSRRRRCSPARWSRGWRPGRPTATRTAGRAGRAVRLRVRPGPGGHPPPDAGQVDLRPAGGARHRPPQPSRDHAGAAAARAPGGRRHPFAGVRAGAVPELARLLRDRHAGLALAARLTLERLTQDDSRATSAAATAALQAHPPAPTTPPSVEGTQHASAAPAAPAPAATEAAGTEAAAPEAAATELSGTELAAPELAAMEPAVPESPATEPAVPEAAGSPAPVAEALSAEPRSGSPAAEPPVADPTDVEPSTPAPADMPAVPSPSSRKRAPATRQ